MQMTMLEIEQQFVVVVVTFFFFIFFDFFFFFCLDGLGSPTSSHSELMWNYEIQETFGRAC